MPTPSDNPGAPGLPALPVGRRVRLVRTTRVLGSTAAAGARAAGAGGRIAWDALAEALPRVPVRDLATLRAQHGGLEGEELADALVRGATAAVAAVGIAGGVAAFGSRRTPAWYVVIPAALATEAVIVAAVEAKLVAELHEVYGVPLRPGSRSRGAAVLGEWASRRDLDPTDPRSLRVLAGLAVRRRSARSVPEPAGRATRMGSAVVGGVAGATVHRRNLGELAESVRADLRASRRNRLPLRGWS